MRGPAVNCDWWNFFGIMSQNMRRWRWACKIKWSSTWKFQVKLNLFNQRDKKCIAIRTATIYRLFYNILFSIRRFFFECDPKWFLLHLTVFIPIYLMIYQIINGILMNLKTLFVFIPMNKPKMNLFSFGRNCEWKCF